MTTIDGLGPGRGQQPGTELGFDIFRQLKERTADIHEQIEDYLPFLRLDFDRENYVRLVERFYGFWVPVEAALWQTKLLENRDLDFAGRMKSSMLETDLRILGREPTDVPLCENLPLTNTFPRCIGCLYVLEGSTLGARIISKRLESHLGLTSASGAAFFNAYGGSVGQRWNEFKTFVTARTAPTDSEDIVIAARQTFMCFGEWLQRTT